VAASLQKCYFAGPRLWSSLPTSLRQITSYGQFRRYLKTHLFGNWEITAQRDLGLWFSALYKYSYLLTYFGWPTCFTQSLIDSLSEDLVICCLALRNYLNANSYSQFSSMPQTVAVRSIARLSKWNIVTGYSSLQHAAPLRVLFHMCIILWT